MEHAPHLTIILLLQWACLWSISAADTTFQQQASEFNLRHEDASHDMAASRRLETPHGAPAASHVIVEEGRRNHDNDELAKEKSDRKVGNATKAETNIEDNKENHQNTHASSGKKHQRGTSMVVDNKDHVNNAADSNEKSERHEKKANRNRIRVHAKAEHAKQSRRSKTTPKISNTTNTTLRSKTTKTRKRSKGRRSDDGLDSSSLSPSLGPTVDFDDKSPSLLPSLGPTADFDDKARFQMKISANTLTLLGVDSVTPTASSVLAETIKGVARDGLRKESQRVKAVELFTAAQTDADRDEKVLRRLQPLSTAEVEYDLVLEELCDADTSCREQAASTTMHEDVTSHMDDKINDGGFTAMLRAEADRQCMGEECGGIQDAEVAGGTFGKDDVVMQTESPTRFPTIATDSPISPPTSSPTYVPSTSWPTWTPTTNIPSTEYPTWSPSEPTTKYPSYGPTTREQAESGTWSPTTLWPTEAYTAWPTWSPTVSPMSPSTQIHAKNPHLFYKYDG